MEEEEVEMVHAVKSLRYGAHGILYKFLTFCVRYLVFEFHFLSSENIVPHIRRKVIYLSTLEEKSLELKFNSCAGSSSACDAPSHASPTQRPSLNTQH